jgi:hypothetical protein
MTRQRPRETDLYAPVKALLEAQGYTVKGEVGAADVVACRGDEDPVVIEMKTGFALSLIHQAIERQAVTDTVYIAVPRGSGAPFRKALKSNTSLCRRLGLGLITVRLRDGFTEVHADPAPYKPRKSARRKAMLLKEFNRRQGDPNTGGSTRRGIVTAYRQDALRCLYILHESGPTKASAVAASALVPRARDIMYRDHYGWFERGEKGIYALSVKGRSAVTEYQSVLDSLRNDNQPSERAKA